MLLARGKSLVARASASVPSWLAESLRIAHEARALRTRVALHILYCVEHLLSENAQPGRAGRVPGTRELVIPNTPYIAAYGVRGATIEVVRVYHSTRRWPDRL